MLVSPTIVGVVNITEDSFSDGGRYLGADAAIDHASRLVEDGANVIELGAASSHPDSAHVPPDVEIARLQPVVSVLTTRGISISIDSTKPAVQNFAANAGASFINDVSGFSDPTTHQHLAAISAKLVVMHSVSESERADRRHTEPDAIWSRIESFFDTRVQQLTRAGVSRDRLILDPGLGFFLGTAPDTSLRVLAHVERLRTRYELPVMVAPSRKSFLQKIAGRSAANTGSATLGAELWAADHGVDYIRTHDVAALRDALTVRAALIDATENPAEYSAVDTHSR